jgi:hypothetical protein
MRLFKRLRELDSIDSYKNVIYAYCTCIYRTPCISVRFHLHTWFYFCSYRGGIFSQIIQMYLPSLRSQDLSLTLIEAQLHWHCPWLRYFLYNVLCTISYRTLSRAVYIICNGPQKSEPVQGKPLYFSLPWLVKNMKLYLKFCSQTSPVEDVLVPNVHKNPSWALSTQGSKVY